MNYTYQELLNKAFQCLEQPVSDSERRNSLSRQAEAYTKLAKEMREGDHPYVQGRR